MYKLYEKNTDMMVENSLRQIQSGLTMVMNNMLYVSEQLINDANIKAGLSSYFDESDYSKRVNLLKYLNTQIAVYEMSNPNIGNVTLFYLDSDNKLCKLNNSLAREKLPDELDTLYTNNSISYFGPHNTFSVASEYLVLSMLRESKSNYSPTIYIYIESGYKQFNDFFTQSISDLDGIYVITSNTGTPLFSSNEEIIPIKSPKSGEKLDRLINSKEFISYSVTDNNDWSLQILVPNNVYQNYMNNLTFGFLTTGIGAIVFGILISYLIWGAINRPLKQFEQNLKNIASDDIKANIQTIHVKEFDENFEYFSNMKLRIVELIDSVKKQEKEKSRIEIKQLLNKINPHFIHNTLDTLKWYSAKNNYHDVEEFVSALNKLLLYNMEKEKATTLKSELEAITNYITLQKLKYELDYVTVINVPEQVLLTELPRFILQPLVENAILHGVLGKGSIKIQVDLLSNGRLSIKVINSGTPIEDEKVKSILEAAEDLSSNGIGIQYVVRMLENKFPGDYGFNIKVTDDNENMVEIIVPYNKGGFYVKCIDS